MERTASQPSGKRDARALHTALEGRSINGFYKSTETVKPSLRTIPETLPGATQSTAR